MTILLVHVPVGFEESYPLALAAIAAPVVASGRAVEGLDLPRVGLSGLTERLARGDVTLVGLSVWSAGVPEARAVLSAAATAGVPSVIGGPHATLRPGDLAATFTVVGEGEETFPALVEALDSGQDASEIPGLWGAPPRPQADLNALPDADRTVFRVADYHRDHNPQGRCYTSVVTSRGCNYHCSFCSARDLWGRGQRTRSPVRVVDEWRRLYVDHHVDALLIEDDLFTQKESHVRGICEAILKTKKTPGWELINGVRPETLTPDLLSLMAAAGCRRIALSIETANPSHLKSMGRATDLGRVETVARAAQRYGIGVTGYFMVGMPGETRADRLATFNFARRLKLDMAHFSVASAWPGTDWTPTELAHVPPLERSALYAAWYLHPTRALRAAKVLGVGVGDLPRMASRLMDWMGGPLEERRR